MAAETHTTPERPSRRGMVVVLVAMTTFITFGFAALSADVGYLYSVSVRLKMVTDSAAIAGAIGLKTNPSTARRYAKDYASLHTVDGIKVVLKDSDIRLGIWDFDTRTFTDLTGGDESSATSVEVIIPRTIARGDPVALFFAPIFGYYDADVSSRSTSSLTTGKAWDLVIVQDITHSFSEEIGDAKTADHVLLDCVTDNTSQDSEMALVAFTGSSQVMSAIRPLNGGGYNQMDSAITNLAICGSSGMPACSGTNQAPGITAATDQLNTLTEGPDVGQGMILVSDGAPNPPSGSSYTVADLQAQTLAAADTAASYGYSIWTVFYDQSNDTAGQAFMASIPRGQGTYLYTPNSADLPMMLHKICEDAIIPSLVD